MQPDDSQSEFKPPEATPYYAASAQSLTDETVAPIVDETSQPSTPQPLPDAAPAELPSDTPIQLPVATVEPVKWQAAEYLHQEKNPLWFVVFGLIVIALIVLAVFLKAWTFVVLIPVMAVALLLYTRRPPQQIDYVLSEKGLYINDILHPFAEFKGFGVIRDGHEYSVMLIPVRRFRPGVTVYFPETSGEAIVDLLGAKLPMQELHLDAFDRVARALRI